jgi:hypothetical protein
MMRKRPLQCLHLRGSDPKTRPMSLAQVRRRGVTKVLDVVSDEEGAGCVAAPRRAVEDAAP